MSKFTDVIKSGIFFMVIAVIGTGFVTNVAAFRRDSAVLASVVLPSSSEPSSIGSVSETEIPAGVPESSVINVTALDPVVPADTTISSSYSSLFSAESSSAVMDSRNPESALEQSASSVIEPPPESTSVQSPSTVIKPPESTSVQSSSAATEPPEREPVQSIPQSSVSVSVTTSVQDIPKPPLSSDSSEPASAPVVSTVSMSAVSFESSKPPTPVDTSSSSAASFEPVSGEPEFDKLNINTASVEELQSLSGIGETKAKAVIAYRIENGGFSSIDELLNVKGIGKSTFEKIRPYITV